MNAHTWFIVQQALHIFVWHFLNRHVSVLSFKSQADIPYFADFRKLLIFGRCSTKDCDSQISGLYLTASFADVSRLKANLFGCRHICSIFCNRWSRWIAWLCTSLVVILINFSVFINLARFFVATKQIVVSSLLFILD